MSNGATVHFIGVLTNVDDTIINFPLDDDFRFELVDRVLLNPILESERHFGFGNSRLLQRFLHNGECWIRRDYKVTGKKLYPNTRQRVEKKRLDLTLRLMRLGHQGNICMPEEYYVTFEGGKKYVGAYKSNLQVPYIDNELFSVTQDEILSLKRFIQQVCVSTEGKTDQETEKNFSRKNQHPLSQSFCNLGLDNFELSFSIHNNGLAFLALITAMEVLFGSGAHRVARNAAVLLGIDKSDSQLIFDELRVLHNKRSKLLHSGKADKITREDVIRLRNYCRRCIKLSHQVNRPKEQLLKELNSLGFGDGSKLQSHTS